MFTKEEREEIKEIVDVAKLTVAAAFEVLKDVGLGTMMAKMYKNLYDALIKEGFSKEEALQIVISMNIGK